MPAGGGGGGSSSGSGGGGGLPFGPWTGSRILTALLGLGAVWLGWSWWQDHQRRHHPLTHAGGCVGVGVGIGLGVGVGIGVGWATAVVADALRGSCALAPDLLLCVVARCAAHSVERGAVDAQYAVGDAAKDAKHAVKVRACARPACTSILPCCRTDGTG